MDASLDNRGRRKSSPSADLIHERRLYNKADPDGAQEKELNNLARRYARLSRATDAARRQFFRNKLAAKCMSFFYVSGRNVAIREDCVRHDGSYCQTDELFLEALVNTIDKYDPSRGVFTHMLRAQYKYARSSAAYRAAEEDTRYGGGKTGAPISFQEVVGDSDGDEGTVERAYGVYDEVDDDPAMCKGSPYSLIEEQIERAMGGNNSDAVECHGRSELAFGAVETSEEAIILEVVALIEAFLGKTGKVANEVRKMYTRMFFSETLTRSVKTRVLGELRAFEENEKRLFRAVDVAFQDSYTSEPCRTIVHLHKVPFVDGIPEVEVPLNDSSGGVSKMPNYRWKLPTAVYVGYLQSIGGTASGPLISQQRKKYEELLGQLVAKKDSK